MPRALRRRYGRANVPLSTDPSLWTTRRVFGVAGGPDEVVLTAEGEARAFSVGAKVKPGDPAEAMERLAVLGGEGLLHEAHGARIHLTDLGHFGQEAWSYLRGKGYVESVGPNGVRLTEAGRRAYADGNEERRYLLERCKRAASATR